MIDRHLSSSASQLAGTKILVVEDETMIALLIEEMLTDLGCSAVSHASGTREAMEKLLAEPPDIVLLDINLPGEPGHVLARHLDAAGIPFVFVTGYGERGVPAEWASRPVIQKPFKSALLAKTLEVLLASR